MLVLLHEVVDFLVALHSEGPSMVWLFKQLVCALGFGLDQTLVHICTPEQQPPHQAIVPVAGPLDPVLAGSRPEVLEAIQINELYDDMDNDAARRCY